MTDPIYRLTIGYDPDTERPDQYGIGRMVSFNDRHINFQHPDEIDQAETLATLAYYEHGNCLWSVGYSPVSDPGNWDTVTHAGAIVWNDHTTAEDRVWWLGLTDSDRARVLAAIAEEFTSWVNGETYYYTIDRLETCDHGQVHAVETIDGCGGFIGSEYLATEVRDLLADLRIDPDDLEYAGDLAELGRDLDLASATSTAA